MMAAVCLRARLFTFRCVATFVYAFNTLVTAYKVLGVYNLRAVVNTSELFACGVVI